MPKVKVMLTLNGLYFGITHLKHLIKKVSTNGSKPCFALKMDIRRFFDTVNHIILKSLIRKRLQDEQVLQIIDAIIDSFSKHDGEKVGIPLGNVTSQLFANVYLHELDDFIKQPLREKYYLRYCDDFIILSGDENHLQSLMISIEVFLRNTLRLELHPDKVSIRKLDQGIDFIGYVLFSNHILVRSRTKQRMMKRLHKTYEAYLKCSVEMVMMDQQLLVLSWRLIARQ